ncbi:MULTISPECIES: FlhC family transcriptional regulator [Pseudomonas]|uniref:FlhC family transcriptional regulator n=1 Tax=Pseudomonas TaxID=286 RepID=UPI000F7A9925|nr:MULTISPECIES: FlhC family transcriptional regulator [Pseudomonas]RRW43147.1 hypothetical protein EGJ50_19155 [Pseudomonas luteola]
MTDNKGDNSNTTHYQSMAAGRKLALARAMLMRKFVTRFIELETSLSKKTLRKIRDELGLPLEDRKGKLQKGVQTIIKNSTERKNAAFFILPYAALNGKKCGEFDVYDVIDAYDIYLASINWHYNQSEKLPRILTINEAYSLALAYIAREVSLEVCPDCGTPFVVFYNTSVTSSSCPNDIARKRLHDTVMDERTPVWLKMKKGPVYAPALDVSPRM